MTTLDATLQWLDSRLATAPPELAEDVLALVRSAGDADRGEDGEAVAELLTRAALMGLTEVADGHGRRQSALRLLSADAALTFAFEAAAELGADVAQLCRRTGPRGEFGRRMADRPTIGEPQ
ncbi:MAG: hypothetical protein M8841_08595 [marine benthic group bacterium]|nr:hypothetical protein [Gemmatimonadota bacterium]MCL7937403.1 hypothetical protein [Gemmatimonadota bacterium]MCL7969971.1 hypothetical protein [Gemmatimonadota bacterium]MCL7976817.1 hypothetical protein [Gemmatimonadota bacterium]